METLAQMYKLGKAPLCYAEVHCLVFKTTSLHWGYCIAVKRFLTPEELLTIWKFFCYVFDVCLMSHLQII